MQVVAYTGHILISVEHFLQFIGDYVVFAVLGLRGTFIFNSFGCVFGGLLGLGSRQTCIACGDYNIVVLEARIRVLGHLFRGEALIANTSGPASSYECLELGADAENFVVAATCLSHVATTDCLPDDVVLVLWEAAGPGLYVGICLEELRFKLLDFSEVGVHPREHFLFARVGVGVGQLAQNVRLDPVPIGAA